LVKVYNRIRSNLIAIGARLILGPMPGGYHIAIMHGFPDLIIKISAAHYTENDYKSRPG
tara:strand:- start:202 stop:378 length:177 start_codon:yes stop_codon:yes gene_type:complete